MIYGFLTIFSLHMLALISPGPDYALITQTALVSTRRHALWTALGLATGVWFHILYSLFGIALIIASSPLAYDVVRYLGAAYLMYLGVKSFRSKPGAAEPPSHKKFSRNDFIAYKQGVLCNMLNPKAMLFFLSVFTVVVDPNTPLWVQSLYGLQMSISTFAWFAWLAIMISHPSFKRRLTHWQAHIGKIMGVVFFLFAFYLLFHIMN
jgi:RhtB (resistance to homoserine/threonine) family protein